MTVWKKMEEAPKSIVTEKKVVREGKEVLRSFVKPIYILAVTSDNNVLKTHWLPQEERWDLFSKNHPPKAWMEVPKYEETCEG